MYKTTRAYSIWKNTIGIPAHKLVKLGDKDNFWPAEPRKALTGHVAPVLRYFLITEKIPVAKKKGVPLRAAAGDSLKSGTWFSPSTTVRIMGHWSHFP